MGEGGGTHLVDHALGGRVLRSKSRDFKVGWEIVLAGKIWDFGRANLTYEGV